MEFLKKRKKQDPFAKRKKKVWVLAPSLSYFFTLFSFVAYFDENLLSILLLVVLHNFALNFSTD